jgi:hypothetical protein
MVIKSKLLILIPVIILVPILLGMPPLNLIQKIGSGCPLAKGKQGLSCSPSYFHSLVSPGDPILFILSSTPIGRGAIPSFHHRSFSVDFTPFLLSLASPPLRC